MLIAPFEDQQDPRTNFCRFLSFVCSLVYSHVLLFSVNVSMMKLISCLCFQNPLQISSVGRQWSVTIQSWRPGLGLESSQGLLKVQHIFKVWPSAHLRLVEGGRGCNSALWDWWGSALTFSSGPARAHWRLHLNSLCSSLGTPEQLQDLSFRMTKLEGMEM